MLWTHRIDITHDFVLSGGGESLHTIIIGDEIYDEVSIESRKDMVDEFLKACPNVRSLSVVDQSGEWSSAFETQLEKLEVVSSPMPKCGPSLLELNICYQSQFKDGFSPFDVSDIDWDNVGNKVECLVLSQTLTSDDGLKRMPKKWKNLKHIDLCTVLTDNELIAEFIASYDDHLDFFYVYNMY